MQFLTLSRIELAVLSILFLWMATPSAGTAQIDTTQTYELDEVIISASRWEESPQSAGRNVTVITSEELRNSTYYSVGELLASQQSLHMVGNGQTPGSVQSAFLRNANSNHSVVMIDGVRISDPSTAGNSPDLSELSLARVERIEIVRGSHSTLYGSSAIGGAINIITRGKGATGFSGSVGSKHGAFGAGTYSTANDLELNYTRQGGLYADFGISQELTNGIDATIDTTGPANSFNPQDQDDFRKLDLSTKVGYSTERLDLHVAYRNVDQTADVDQGAYSDARDAQVDFGRHLLNYGGSYRLSESWQLSYRGAYSDLQRDFVNDSSIINNAGDYDGSYTETNAEGTLLENELTLRWESQHSSTIAGIGNSRQTMSTRTYTYLSSYNYESETDLDSLDLRESIDAAFLHTELRGSLFGQQMEAFSLGLGTRWVNHNEFGSHFTFEINPSVELGAGAFAYGAITSGFNAPSLYQLYSPATSPGYLTSRGNQTLEPETSVSYELGWKQQLGSSLRLNLSLFRTNVDDVIEYVYLWDAGKPADQLSAQDYRGDTYLNASRQQVNGIEFGFEGQLLNRLQVGGNASYTHSTLQFRSGDIDQDYTQGTHVQIYESGEFITESKELESLTRRPSFSGNIFGDYAITDHLSMRASLQYVGERNDIFYSSNLGPGFYGALDRSDVQGYTITDLTARYQLTESLKVIGKVENLFDTDYVEINGYQTRGRGWFLKGRFSF